MLSTGDIRDWDAVVDQVLRCLVLRAPVDRRRQLKLHTLRDMAKWSLRGMNTQNTISQ